MKIRWNEVMHDKIEEERQEHYRSKFNTELWQYLFYLWVGFVLLMVAKTAAGGI